MKHHATHTAPEPVTLDSLHAELVELRALVVERLPASVPMPDSDAKRFIAVSEAARLAGVSTQTIRNWIDRYNIGRFVDPAQFG